MLKGVLLLTGLLLFAFGAESLFYAVTSRQQITVTCDAFAQSPPRDMWLRITGCEMDYLGAGYREWNGRIAELYFPARPAGSPRTEPARLVATTRDPSVLALAEETIGGGQTPNQEQFLVMMLKIVTALRSAREIEGYRKATVLNRLGSQSALAGLSTPLSPNVVVVDLHAKPRLILPATATAAGVMLVGMFVLLRSRRRAAPPVPVAAELVEQQLTPATEVQEEQSIQAMGEHRQEAVIEPPVESLSVSTAPGDVAAVRREPGLTSATRLRLMLLKLPPDAGRDAIESAPPLGSRSDVIAAVTQSVPGLNFDASGHAAIGRIDFLLTIDIGPTDPVYTAVVDARGVAALPMVRRVLDRTGWRAFAPKTGTFIAAEQLDEHAARPLDHTAA